MDVEPAESTEISQAVSQQGVSQQGVYKGESADGKKGDNVDGRREEDEDDMPALFMTTMPRDVWANSSLGALAALIDEGLDDGDKDTAAAQGKCSLAGGAWHRYKYKS